VLDLFFKIGYDAFIRSKGKKMTVSELMTILNTCDPTAKVYTLNMISGEYVTPYIEIDEVEDGDGMQAVIIDCGE